MSPDSDGATSLTRAVTSQVPFSLGVKSCASAVGMGGYLGPYVIATASHSSLQPVRNMPV